MVHRFGLVIAILLAGKCCWAGYGYNGRFVTWGALSNNMGGKFTVETFPSSTDGYDNQYWDVPLDTQSHPKPFYVATYKTNGVDGWNAADGFYAVDSRSKLSAWQTVIEDIYLWAAPSTPAEGILLWFAADAPFQGGTFTLRLVSVPNGIAYTGPTVWGLSDQYYIGPFPYYSTTDGRTGYHFQAEFTAVPEPSSILALMGGIAGLGGFALRRRRQ